MRSLTALVATLALSAPLAAQTTAAAPANAELAESQYLALGKKYIDWFFMGRADSLLAHMAPGAQQPTAEEIVAQRDQLIGRAGNEKKVLVEKMTRRKGKAQFWHEAEHETMDEPIVLRLVMTPEGEIAGFGMSPKSQVPPTDPF